MRLAWHHVGFWKIRSVDFCWLSCSRRTLGFKPGIRPSKRLVSLHLGPKVAGVCHKEEASDFDSGPKASARACFQTAALFLF